jgi:mRNA interferase MazF
MDFDPGLGHEQRKRRPALVLSPMSFNRKFGLVFVAPVTSTQIGHAFEVPLPVGLAVTGTVMVHQIKSFDWEQRRGHVVGRAPASVLSRAVEIIERILKPA